MAVDALAAHCHISMLAWRTADGLQLAQPLRSQLDFTPALVQCAPSPAPSKLTQKHSMILHLVAFYTPHQAWGYGHCD